MPPQSLSSSSLSSVEVTSRRTSLLKRLGSSPAHCMLQVLVPNPAADYAPLAVSAASYSSIRNERTNLRPGAQLKIDLTYSKSQLYYERTSPSCLPIFCLLQVADPQGALLLKQTLRLPPPGFSSSPSMSLTDTPPSQTLPPSSGRAGARHGASTRPNRCGSLTDVFSGVGQV